MTPDIALAPCLGCTDDRSRLGWGYFDRTLAVLVSRPMTISITLSAARLPTICPQPHHIPIDMILAEDGAAAKRTDR